VREKPDLSPRPSEDAVERSSRSVAGSAVLWLGVYLALVLTPLLALLIGERPPGLGFRPDLAVALGFAGLSMMAVQFLLTARFRRATAPFGIDVIYYFHRYLGTVILAAVIAHPVLFIVDNPALVDFLNPVVAPGHMTAGVVSTAALVALMVTSVWRQRLAIAYERWRLAHTALAVAAVGLALVHVEGVQYYTASPGKQALWRAIALSWIVTTGYVRLVRPWQLSRRPYRVAEVTRERGDAWTVTLEPERHAGVAFQPGQFAWLTLRAGPFAMKEHPFSFSSAPGRVGGRVAFTIKELGDFTRTIGSIQPGERAFVDAPYGAFTIDRHPAPGYVFIAGGIGIAPFMSMLRAMADRDDRRPVLLIYAYRRAERMTFREEIDALQSRLALTFVPVLEEPPADWNGERGRITSELLARHRPADWARRQYFLCGPEAMTQAVEHQLHAAGVPLSHVTSELFDLV
jgi:predicted ferric reductase